MIGPALVNRGPGLQEQHPRVAIAHDYLTQHGGAERVVLALHQIFPEAPIYTTLYEPQSTYPEFADADIRTGWLNKFAPFRANHRYALPLYPLAVAMVNINADVVIASASAWAHGFHRTGKMIVYCHSPARFLYQSQEYLGGPLWRSPEGIALALLRRPMVRRDHRMATRADRYLANSSVVRERIREIYGIEAEVVPPPAGRLRMDGPPPGNADALPGLSDWARSGYHLVVSRLLPYKNVQTAVRAFAGMPGQRLVVVGDGPLRAQLNAEAGNNVRFLTGLSDTQLSWVYAHARALVAPSHEDFGLTPVEAASYGIPTLALRAGGYLDTVQPGVTGLFFEHPTPHEISEAVLAAEARVWDASAIRRHAAQFDQAHFARRICAVVEEVLALP